MTAINALKLSAALALASCALSPHALQVDSGHLIHDGDTLIVENLNSGYGYENSIHLRKASGAGEFLFVDDAGGQKSFSHSSHAGYGIDPGGERVFFSKAPDYFLPRLSYPVFGLARITSLPDAWFEVGFEDKIVRSDENFSDAVFRTRGVGGSVPEPASLALFGFGLIGFGLARRLRNPDR